MPDAIDLDSIAAQMKAAAERALNPGRHEHVDWLTGDPVLAVRTDLTGARVVASNPAHILAILAEREALKMGVYTGATAGIDDEFNHPETWRERAEGTLQSLIWAKRRAKRAEDERDALTAKLAEVEDRVEYHSRSDLGQLGLTEKAVRESASLRALLAKAEEAIEPFIPEWESWMDEHDGKGELILHRHGRTFDELRRARAVLDEVRKAKP